MRRLFRLALLGIVALQYSTLHAGGTLNPAIPVSGVSGTSPDLTVGPGDTVLVTYAENGNVGVAYNPGLGGATLTVTSTGDASKPVGFVGPSGVTSVVYQKDDLTVGALGDEIFAVDNQGGPFSTPVNLSQSLASDVEPRITGGTAIATRSVAWVEQLAGDSVIRFSENLGPPAVVATGDAIATVAQPGVGVHLVYTRSGNVYHRIREGGVLGSETPVTSGVGDASAPTVAIDPVGALHVGYVSGTDVYYVRRDASGTFAAPINVSNSGAPSIDPQIAIGSGGLTIIYVQGGDIWRVRAAGIILLPPDNLTSTAFVFESQPTADIDSNGFLHLAYKTDTGVAYRNEVPGPSAAFDYSLATGEAPLQVTFSSLSTGVIGQRTWDFGDGTTSSMPNPTHVYEQSGSFTVSLTVAGPGGEDTAVVADAIQVIDASNFMWVPRVEVFQNQSGVYIPILATNSAPIQGFQVSIQWDCNAIDVQELTVNQTQISSLAPEFVVSSVDADCFAILGVVFDIASPFDGRTFPPRVGARFANLVANVPFDAPPGISYVELVNGLSSPPIFNIFTVDGISILPVLGAGELEVRPFAFPPPPLFVRSDADFNGVAEITDAIYLLAFLFSGGPAPVCPDAADANDSGVLDVSDAIFILTFLFAGGAYPLPPFPNLGLDPTEDALGDC